MIKPDINKIEKQILKWFFVKRHMILIFLLLGFFSYLLPSIPYLNFFINSQFSTFLVLSFVIILFSISPAVLVVVLVSLLSFILIFYFLEEYERGELLANFMYGLLFVYIISKIISLPKDEK